MIQQARRLSEARSASAELWIGEPQLSDVDDISRLLLQLYLVEAPALVPGERELFRKLIASTLRRQPPEQLACGIVIRSALDRELVGYVALSPDFRPRKTVLDAFYAFEAVRLFGVRTSAHIFLRQFRLMALLTAPLPKGTAQLHSLVVDQNHRGSGIASKLVRAVEERAAELRQKAMLLYILRGNPLDEMYEHLGYRHCPVPRSRSLWPHPGVAMLRAL